MKTIVSTENAPAAVGTYSQAVRAGNTVYMSGQVPLDPATMKVVDGDFKAQTRQVFENLKAVAEAAGGSLADIVKLNVFIIDMAVFPQVSEVMGDYFEEPYPARACVAVAALPLGVPVEMEAVMVLAD
ncbi:MAG: RidA family protein [Coxiellaceae bacterium]|nr:RidA family protein [Coxiellaceae bacterium]